MVRPAGEALTRAPTPTLTLALASTRTRTRTRTLTPTPTPTRRRAGLPLLRRHLPRRAPQAAHLPRHGRLEHAR
eukprot:scaffold32065_cov51-Phaeocystis_antarctica.AAC.1